jgi:hypothetical protein
MLGAALTVLGQLGQVMPLASWLQMLVGFWQQITRSFCYLPITWIGAPLHHGLVAALSLATFMAMMGVGARVSAQLTGAPLSPIVLTRWLDGMSWPNLIVFTALVIIFLLGHRTSAPDPLVIWGSPTAGKYAFALTVTAGYIAGDYFGHDEFHRRLVRLAALVVVIIGANFAARALPPMKL